IANCDEFIYYDDLVRKAEQRRTRKKAPAKSGRQAAQPPAAQIFASNQEPGAAESSAATSASTGAAGANTSPPKAEDERKQEAFDLVLSTIEALADERDEDEKVWGSMIKQAIKRQRPGFNESYHGFRSFSELLEEARSQRLIDLEKDEKSGGYIVRAVT